MPERQESPLPGSSAILSDIAPRRRLVVTQELGKDLGS